MLALGGVQLSYRPDLWQAYGSATDRVKQAARPLDDLKRRFPARAAEIDAAIHATGRLIDSLTYLPMVGRKSFWTVVLDAQSAQVLTFIPLDPY
jgi:ABC-type transporter Mla subunit MlaD